MSTPKEKKGLFGGARRLVGHGIHELRHRAHRYTHHHDIARSPAKGDVEKDSATTPMKKKKRVTIHPDVPATSSTDAPKDELILDYSSKDAERRFVRSLAWPVAERKKLVIGKVSVRVVEAAYLPSIEGKPSPYCVVNVENSGWQSKTVRHDNGPTWNEDSVDFYVSKHDAKLSVQVLDQGESHDDVLGCVDIPLEDLAGLGTIRRFYALRSDEYDEQTGSIHLHITYDVSSVGEAVSRLWIDDRPPPKEYPPFDINHLYSSVFTLRGEMKPYLDAGTDAERLLKWLDVNASRKWFVVAMVLALCVDYLPIIFHVGLAIFLVRNYVRKQQLDKLKSMAVQIFAKIDTDNNGEIDRMELGTALRELIVKAKCECNPTEADIDNLFNRFANHNHRLELDDLIDLLMYAPKIVWGYDKVAREEEMARQREEQMAFEPNQESLSISEDSQASSSSDLEAAISDELNASSHLRRSLNGALLRVSRRKGGRRTAEGADEVASSTGPVKGVARKIINLAGRKYTGRSVAWAIRKANFYSTELSKVRIAFSWEIPKLSWAVLLANLALAYWHFFVPFRISCFVAVLMAFFYYTDKKRAFLKIVGNGKAAYRRFKSLKTKTNLRFDLIEQDESNLPAIPQRTRGNARTHGLMAVVRGIFSRLDADGDGKVDPDELEQFIRDAVPRAIPELRSSCHVADISNMFVDFNKQRGRAENAPMNLDSLSSFVVRHTSNTAALLVQDELRRQLETSGTKCLKLPSKHETSLPRSTSGGSDSARRHHHRHHHIFGAHQTLLTLREQKRLGYTNKRGMRVSLDPDTLVDIKSGRENSIYVLFRDSSETKTIVFSLAPELRDPLLALLRAILLPTLKANYLRSKAASSSSDTKVLAVKSPEPPTPRVQPQLATTVKTEFT